MIWSGKRSNLLLLSSSESNDKERMINNLDGNCGLPMEFPGIIIWLSMGPVAPTEDHPYLSLGPEDWVEG